MTTVALVQVEHVLMRPLDTVMSSPLIPTGALLVGALSKTYRIVLASVDHDYNEVAGWLAVNALSRLPMDIIEAGSEDTIAECRRRYGCDLYLTPDPAGALFGLEQGLQTLLFCEPAYARPEFRTRTSRGIVTWSALEARVDADRARLSRIDDEDVVGDSFER